MKNFLQTAFGITVSLILCWFLWTFLRVGFSSGLLDGKPFSTVTWTPFLKMQFVILGLFYFFFTVPFNNLAKVSIHYKGSVSLFFFLLALPFLTFAPAGWAISTLTQFKSAAAFQRLSIWALRVCIATGVVLGALLLFCGIMFTSTRQWPPELKIVIFWTLSVGFGFPITVGWGRLLAQRTLQTK